MLTKHPKLNYLRVRVTLHRLRHGKEIAVSYTDSRKMIHRTPFLRSRYMAEKMLRLWLQEITGVGLVTLIATAEVLHDKGDA